MIFPEFLFRLSQRDQQVTWLDPVSLQVSSAVAAASITAIGTVVPIDRVLVLTNAIMLATAGAAQTTQQQSLQVVAVGGFVTTIAIDTIVSAAAGRAPLNWAGQVLVPPSWTVRAVGTFNAGAAVNNVDISLHGILIPAGNIQRV
jgi:hypothetical protein